MPEKSEPPQEAQIYTFPTVAQPDDEQELRRLQALHDAEIMFANRPTLRGTAHLIGHQSLLLGMRMAYRAAKFGQVVCMAATQGFRERYTR